MAGNGNSSNSLSFVFQSPSTGKSLQECLDEGFDSDICYDRFKVLAATVSDRGIARVEDKLTSFCENGGEVEIYIGLSMGPDPNGIRRLKRLQNQYPGLVSLKLINNERKVNLFHPKIYWFHSDTQHRIIIGSPNWSDLGLENNVEAFSIITESLDKGEPSEFLTEMRDAFDEVRGLDDLPDSWGSLHSPSESILEQLESTDRSGSKEERTEVELDMDLSSRGSLWPLSRTAPELVMELNKESRMSQIVPPNEIWERFFGVDPEEFRKDDPELPTLELRNVANDEHSQRGVVDHDHQGTVEITEAKNRKDPSVQRAFLIFRKTDTCSFDYQLFLENEDEEAEQIAEFLESHGYTPGHSSRLTFVSKPN